MSRAATFKLLMLGIFSLLFFLSMKHTALAAGRSELVFSRFGREAVFVEAESADLMAAPEKGARKLGQADHGSLLWRMEEDVDDSGWDRINDHGRIVYVETSLLSMEDPEDKIQVTTNKKYYYSMKDIALAYDAGDMQAREFAGMSNAEVIEMVAPICQEDMKNSGILASVTLAQFILESGYGKSLLAIEANNCFGMKASLSGNDWEGSTWDGVSVCNKRTSEQNSDGSRVSIIAGFRAYPSVAASIADHSAYLANAKAGKGLRYGGVVGCKDYKKAVKIIKQGGYATSHNYVESICAVIRKWDLDQYDE